MRVLASLEAVVGALLAALRVMYGSGAPRYWQAYLGY